MEHLCVVFAPEWKLAAASLVKNRGSEAVLATVVHGTVVGTGLVAEERSPSILPTDVTNAVNADTMPTTAAVAMVVVPDWAGLDREEEDRDLRRAEGAVREAEVGKRRPLVIAFFNIIVHNPLFPRLINKLVACDCCAFKVRRQCFSYFAHKAVSRIGCLTDTVVRWGAASRDEVDGEY
ncbi:hypothetical protein FGIG_03932 [Fasciola gigantica]|uniref:Uncharacterized protein n=1 Tax=Fasciola gigantica TaxID=46835 RepID=A0A504YUC9_FASGI|nr:hypothetical protein FGIG_03932 [Fasciola gigantica]